MDDDRQKELRLSIARFRESLDRWKMLLREPQNALSIRILANSHQVHGPDEPLSTRFAERLAMVRKMFGESYVDTLLESMAQVLVGIQDLDRYEGIESQTADDIDD